MVGTVEGLKVVDEVGVIEMVDVTDGRYRPHMVSFLLHNFGY